MEKFTINYSTKNILIPSKKLYLKTLTDKVENVIKHMRGEAFIYDRGDTDDKNENTNAGIFKSRQCHPQHQDLMKFEHDLLDMIKHISFKPTKNEFQTRLQK